MTFSQDDDFLRLHAAGLAHAGIIYASRQSSIGDIIRRLMLIYEVFEPEDFLSHLEYL